MRPILFSKTATSFDTNGIGRLECTECRVTEERNGIYELEAVVPECAALASSVEMDSIIVAKPSEGASFQGFRVYKITKPINGLFTVFAQHISYQLSNIPTMPFTINVSTSACSQTLATLKTNAVESCPFSFWTDVTTVAGYSQSVPASIRSRLGGVEGSVLDSFGGEYEWDNYSVKLHKNRGVTVPTVTLKYGKNITDLSQEEEISSTVTGVCPYWADDQGNIVTLPEKVVNSQYAGNYAYKRTVPLDMSQDFESQPTVQQLRSAAQAYVNQTGLGVPVVSISVSFVHLADTEEYKDIAPLETVKLCDQINVYFEKLGISTTAKVVKTVYNVLTEKYESIDVGSVRTGLATTISSTAGAIESMEEFVRTNATNATAWLTGSNGYVVAVRNTDGTWKELLFLDTNNTSTARNVLRINENGIGFSRNGINGPYTQAWTLDGKIVIGGTNVPSLTVYKNNDQILFQVDGSGMEWNAVKSSMTKAGVLTAAGATLTEANITGTLSVYSGNTLIFQIGSSGLYWNLLYSSMTRDGKLTARQAALTGSLKVLNPNDEDNPFLDADSNGVAWNTTNSSMTKQGTLTAQNASLKGSFTCGNDNYSKIMLDSNGSIKGFYSGDQTLKITTSTNWIGSVQGGGAKIDAPLLGIGTNTLLVANSDNPDTYYTTYNGNVITDVSGQNISYVSNLNISVDFDREDVEASWDNNTTYVYTSYSYRVARNGIIT